MKAEAHAVTLALRRATAIYERLAEVAEARLCFLQAAEQFMPFVIKRYILTKLKPGEC